MWLTDCSLKMGSSDFKYNNAHVFARYQIYKAKRALWEMLTLANPVSRQRPHKAVTRGRAADFTAGSAINIHVFLAGPKVPKSSN
jgi:hypothetical protein